MLHQNTLFCQTAVLRFLFFCERIFLGLLFGGLAIFVIFADALKSAVAVNSDRFPYFLADFIFVHFEIMSTPCVGRYGYDLFGFFVDKNEQLYGVLFFLSGVPNFLPLFGRSTGVSVTSTSTTSILGSLSRACLPGM